MNTRETAGRVRALGRRLHGTVKRFFEAPIGPDAKPLEIREAMLEDVERHVTPIGGGRRVFPFARVVGHVATPAGARSAVEATFRDFDARVRARLAELRCEAPPALDVRVVVLKKTPAHWETGRLFALDYREVEPATIEASTRPVLHVTVLAGAASQAAYTIENPTVLVGRGVEPVDGRGRVRGNHVAFAESGDDAAQTVGRAHARFTWDAAAAEYRVYDEGSSNGTQVIRGGTTLTVPSRDPRGVRVRTGDEIQFGRARVRIKVRTARSQA